MTDKAATPDPDESSATTRYDVLLKWALNQAHDAFLTLIAPELAWRGERSPEAPAIARLADLVWEVVNKLNGERGLLHIELQLKVENNIGERLAEYAIRLWRRDHLPVRSIVVFLRKAASTPTSPFVIRWGQQESLRYTFEVRRVWEIPYQQALIPETYALWSLVGLMAGTNVESAVGVAGQLAVAPISQQERSEYIGLLASLAGIVLSREPLLAALRRIPMLDELLESSSVAQAFREKGLEKGRQEGRQEGLAEGIQQTLLAILEGRFGVVPDDIRAAVAQADVTTLTEVARQSATAPLEQLRARLGLPTA